MGLCKQLTCVGGQFEKSPSKITGEYSFNKEHFEIMVSFASFGEKRLQKGHHVGLGGKS